MTSVIDMVDGGVDPQAEVRKLQDLVKKLETQNEVLRRKQKLGNDSNIIQDNDLVKSGVNNSVFYNTKKKPERKDTASSDSLETVDLIDIEKCINDKEDSWLYSSPRPATPLQNKVSPYKWVRQDFDNPTPDVQSARKSLKYRLDEVARRKWPRSSDCRCSVCQKVPKYRLDEVARMSRSSSTPAFQNYATPPKGAPTSMSLSADSTPSPRLTQHAVRSLQGSSSKISTGTFTRPKKSKDRPSPSSVNGDDTKENVDSVHHPNVADIENLAKLQEESLRQSIAQTSPRRGFRSRPMPNVSNQNDNDSSSPAGSNRSSPARYMYEEGMNRRNSRESLGSDQSSPPDSPYGSNQQLNNTNSTSSNLRGSFPNVSRLVPRAQHHNSDSSLAEYQPEDNTPSPEHSRYTSRVQQSQLQRPSSPSVSGLKQPQRSLRGPSPQRTGLPSPASRRTIPRPGSAGTPRSNLPAPRRISGLPPPRNSGNGPPQQQQPRFDDSWKEGCF